MKENEHIRTRALTAVARLWDEGCPVAGPDGRERMVNLGLRRWRSYPRRTRQRHWTEDDRVQDLAKGLRDAVEPDGALTGRLLDDYRCVAKAIAAAHDGAQEHPSPAGGKHAETAVNRPPRGLTSRAIPLGSSKPDQNPPSDT